MTSRPSAGPHVFVARQDINSNSSFKSDKEFKNKEWTLDEIVKEPDFVQTELIKTKTGYTITYQHHLTGQVVVFTGVPEKDLPWKK